MTDPAFSRPESRPSSNPLTTDVTASPTNDAASSLRAAALLTLKAKRRKPTTEASAASVPASRPIPTADSLLLDYGQEDSSSQPPIPPTPALASDSALTSSNPAPASIQPPITDDEDGQIREEGEISEEEEAPVVAPQLSSSPHVQDLDTRMGSPPSASVNINARYLKSSPPRRSSPLAGPSSPIPALVNRISDPQSYTSFYDEEEADPSHEIEMENTSHSDQSFFLLDADHVRPGLSLSQLEYDTAKDLVLDLLGWGVPPEYLVDCGLTWEMVYYVFSELNLRLPQNLNLTGLIPYTPDLLMTMTSQQLSVAPTPTPARQEVPSLLQRLQLGSHLPVPPQREETPPRASGSDFPGSVQTSPTGDLHDIERQRRQELLARKAVQASRKTKQTPASTDSTPTSAVPRQPSEPPRSADNQKFEMTSPVPTELVEDFLKTIGSIQSPSTQSKVSTPEPPHQFNIDAMDIDEIPGLGMARHSASVSRTSSLPDMDHDSLAHQPVYADHMVISPSTLSHPPTSAESASSAFTHTSTSTTKMSIDNSSNPGTDHQESSSTFSIQQRRRPVASDFVDFDSMPRSATTTNSGYSSSYARYARKDTGANFSNVAMKRCVIDLSDSEGEDDEHHIRDVKRAKSRGYASPAPSIPNPGYTSGWATPPMQGSMTPAVLAEKELEIQRMKEMILQKEKQQKLAKERAIRRSEASTPTATFDSYPSAPVPTITVKQEEDEPRAVTSLSSHLNGSPVASHQLNGNQPNDSQSKSATPGLSGDSSIVPLSTSTSASVDASASASPSLDNPTCQEVAIMKATQPITGDQVLTAEARHEQVMNPPSRSSTREEQQQQQQEGSKDIIVDVDPTSTQIQQMTQSIHPEQDGKLPPSMEVKSGEDYATYASPFELYPFLRYRSQPMSSDRLAINSQASSSTSSSVIPSTTLVSSIAQSSLPSAFPAASIYPSSLSTPSFTSQSSSSSSSVPIPDLRPLKLATSSRMLDPSKRICQYEVPGGGVCRDEHCEDLHLSRIMGSGTDVGSGVEPSDEETAEYLYNVMPSNWLTTHNVSTSNIVSALREARQVRKTPMVLDERVEQALSSLGSPPPPPPPT